VEIMSSYKNSSAIIFLIITLFSIHWVTTKDTNKKFVFKEISINKQTYYSKNKKIDLLFEQINNSTTTKIKKRKLVITDIIISKNYSLIQNDVFKEKVTSSLYFLFNTHLSSSLNTRAPPSFLSI
jgi:hypothetical protein